MKLWQEFNELMHMACCAYNRCCCCNFQQSSWTDVHLGKPLQERAFHQRRSWFTFGKFWSRKKWRRNPVNLKLKSLKKKKKDLKMEADDGIVSLLILFLWSDHHPAFILRAYYSALGRHKLGSFLPSSLILLIDIWPFSPCYWLYR